MPDGQQVLSVRTPQPQAVVVIGGQMGETPADAFEKPVSRARHQQHVAVDGQNGADPAHRRSTACVGCH
jgi:hypothetical protein